MSDQQDQAEDVGLVTPHDQSDPSKDDDTHILQLRQVMTYSALQGTQTVLLCDLLENIYCY